MSAWSRTVAGTATAAPEPRTPASIPARSARSHRLAWPAVAVLLPAVAYAFVPRAFFWADDFLNLFEIGNRGAAEFILRMHGGHLLLLRNALFVLTFRVFGTHAAGYFSFVYATHVLNALLLFRLIRNLTASPKLACVGAAVWGTLPVAEGALTWYSVYGEVLAGTFLLAVLEGVTHAGTTDGRVGRAAPLLWAAFLLGAMTSFGVGLGATLAMPVVAFLLLPPSSLRTRTLSVLVVAAAAAPVLYSATQRVYIALYGGTPPSVVLIAGLAYWRQHLRLLADLLGVGVTSILLGPLQSLQSYPDPFTYALVAAYAFVLGSACVVGGPAVRRRILGLAVFAVAVYGIIAAGRGMFWRPAARAWLARTPRFHYVGTAPVAAALCVALATLGERLRPKAWLTTLAAAVVLAALAASSVRTGIVARDPPGTFARTETTAAIASIRAAIDRTPPGETAYVQNQPFKSVGFMLVRQPEAFPGWAALFTVYFPANVVDGRRVVFVESNPSVLAAAATGRRTADLLVPAPER